MRQFIVKEFPDKDGMLKLESKDFKYLKQVLRVQVGNMINVRLPSGNLQSFTIAKIDEKNKNIILQLCDKRQKPKDNNFDRDLSVTRGVQADEIEKNLLIKDIEYTLIQFIPKPVKFEQIVRQATECGIKNIIPVIGEFSEKSSIMALQASGTKKDRLERIVKEARQQSGSPIDTQIFEPMTLEAAVDFWNQQEEEKEAFLLYERNEKSVSLKEILTQDKNIKKIAIAVGCEGGISPKEFEYLCKKGLFNSIHFSVNILRCETAAIYGIAAIQSAM